MSENNNPSAYYALIYLISCKLSGKKAEKEIFDYIPVGEIYSAARRCSLDSILTSALEDIGITSSRSAEKKLLSIKKAMLFDAARSEILSRLEEEKIKYLPLKGVILKDYYPGVGLRQMADNDILFDASCRGDVRDIMKSLGYSVEHYGRSNHDVYMKEPVLNFEMHTELFNESISDIYVEYFKTVWERAIRDDDNNYGFHLSDNDFYIYIKTHEYKHFSAGGTGLRSLVDTFVFLFAKESSLDFGYIEEECEKLGIGEYERLSRRIAKRIFDPECSKALLDGLLGKCPSPISKDEAHFLSQYLFVGTYGTEDRHIANLLKKERKKRKTALGAKLGYLLSRIFPPMSFFVGKDEKARRRWYLYPVFWIIRVLTIVFCRPVRTLKTIGRVFRSKNDGD